MDRLLLDEAYRKLKGSVYWDKSLPYLRSEIVRFENDHFEERMMDIFNAINDDEKWQEFEERVLSSIKAYTFPKELDVVKEVNQGPIVISNVCSESPRIKRYNNFIDISIEGHIIGVLWILLVGHRIDKNLYENCFGHRLYDSLVFPESKVSESPNLFKPYFVQYESWRNQSLECAKNVIDQENNSVVITMLDISRYYYSIDFSESLYGSITNVDYEDDETNRINGFIYKVLVQYSRILGNENKVILPIGFLPSNILANAYLQAFDLKVNNSKDIVYYGRYVDDMIIVSRIESGDLDNSIEDNGIKAVSSFVLNALFEDRLIEIENDETIRFVGYTDLYVQTSKMRCFYVDKDGYDTLIGKIKRDLERNTSEFNYLPEQSVTELNEDIINFDRVDSVNKLRAINGVSIDKYALSKAIGKNIKMSPFAEGVAINRFIRSINQFLDHNEIINNYNQWESVLNYYVVNERWDSIEAFSAKVVLAIAEMDEDSNKRDVYYYLKNRGIHSVGDSLVKYYLSCLTRSLSIAWGKRIRDLLVSVSNMFSEKVNYTYYLSDSKTNTMKQERKYYCNSRMIDRRLLPISVEECMSSFAPNDDANTVVCFNQLKTYLESSGKYRYSKIKAKYKPYISTPFELLYTLLLKEIKNEYSSLYNDIHCVEYACRNYAKNFNSLNEVYINDLLYAENYDGVGNRRVVVGTQDRAKKKYRIAVANVEMNTKDIFDSLSNKRKNISVRYKEIVRIINEAIRYSADVLLFPEAYIPLTLLPIIQMEVAKHNMVIIGGIEHVRRNNYVYNITTTLVPLIDHHMRYTVPFFHLKNYYSPDEEKNIINAGCVPAVGNGYTLFSWNGLSFVTYCCYELTSIEQRSLFKREADIVFCSEWNSDTHYFSNIIESLSRDRCCFCAQSNKSEYGDSRIVQPTSSVYMDVARIKGGVNGTVVIGDIDVGSLRTHKKKRSHNRDASLPKKGFKPLSAGY